MRYNGDWMLLVVIGWQPVVSRAYKCLEEAPSLPGKLPQKDDLVGGQARFPGSQWLANPPCDHRRSNPKTQDGRRGTQGCWLENSQIDRQCHGKNGTYPHRSRCRGKVLAAIPVHVSRSIP